MGMSSEEIARMMAEDISTGGVIGHEVHCKVCGYNLQSLPYVYNCPECGSAYNANALDMRGVWRNEEYDFPFGEIFSTFICLLIATVLCFAAVRSADIFSLLYGVAFLVLTGVFGVRSFRTAGNYVHMRAIARRIENERIARLRAEETEP